MQQQNQPESQHHHHLYQNRWCLLSHYLFQFPLQYLLLQNVHLQSHQTLQENRGCKHQARHHPQYHLLRQCLQHLNNLPDVPSKSMHRIHLSIIKLPHIAKPTSVQFVHLSPVVIPIPTTLDMELPLGTLPNLPLPTCTLTTLPLLPLNQSHHLANKHLSRPS